MENEENNNPSAPRAVLSSVRSRGSSSRNPFSSLFSKIPHPKIVLPVIFLALLGAGALIISSSVRGNQEKQLQVKIYGNMNRGNFVTMGNLAKQGLKSSPNNPYLLQSVINANSMQGNQTGKEQKALEESKPYIEQALQGNKKDADTFIAIGYAYETAGDYTIALDYYKKAIAANPNSSDAYFHKGHVLAFLDKSVESKAAYDKSYSLDPNNPLILIVKGNEFQGLGDNQKATDSFNKVAENTKNPSGIRAEALTASALVFTGEANYRSALQYSGAAVTVNPTYALGLGMYGFNEAIEGKNVTKGIYYLNKGINQNPGQSFNYLLMAYVLRGIGKEKDAIVFQKKELALIPTDNTIVGSAQKQKSEGLALYELAQTYSLLHDTSNSLGYLKQSISHDETLKEKLRKDFVKGYFSSLKGNPEFSILINT